MWLNDTVGAESGRSHDDGAVIREKLVLKDVRNDHGALAERDPPLLVLCDEVDEALGVGERHGRLDASSELGAGLGRLVAPLGDRAPARARLVETVGLGVVDPHGQPKQAHQLGPAVDEVRVRQSDGRVLAQVAQPHEELLSTVEDVLGERRRVHVRDVLCKRVLVGRPHVGLVGVLVRRGSRGVAGHLDALASAVAVAVVVALAFGAEGLQKPDGVREGAGAHVEAESLACDVRRDVGLVEDGDVEGRKHGGVAAQMEAQHRVVGHDDLGLHRVRARSLGEAALEPPLALVVLAVELAAVALAVIAPHEETLVDLVEDAVRQPLLVAGVVVPFPVEQLSDLLALVFGRPLGGLVALVRRPLATDEVLAPLQLGVAELPGQRAEEARQILLDELTLEREVGGDDEDAAPMTRDVVGRWHQVHECLARAGRSFDQDLCAAADGTVDWVRSNGLALAPAEAFPRTREQPVAAEDVLDVRGLGLSRGRRGGDLRDLSHSASSRPWIGRPPPETQRGDR